MKKNIYNLLKLFESFSDLFDDDILADDITSDLSRKFAENNLKSIVVDILGIDKPRGWKYEKINNKEVLVHRGRKGSFYPDKVLDDIENYGLGDVIVHHINCENEGKELANRLKEKLGIDNIKIQSIGPLIGLHVGPGSIGVAYHY